MKSFFVVSILCLSSVCLAAEKEQKQEVKEVNWEKVKFDTVNGCVEYLKSVKTFAEEQIPALISEILRWKKIQYIFSVCLFAFLTWFFIYCLSVDTKSKGNKDENIAILFIGFLAVVSFISALFFAYKTIYIYCAPKMYMLEYFIDLIK